ncbi:hypothetical protein S245_048882, partial [Arachis hypogaea]
KLGTCERRVEARKPLFSALPFAAVSPWNHVVANPSSSQCHRPFPSTLQCVKPLILSPRCAKPTPVLCSTVCVCAIFESRGCPDILLSLSSTIMVKSQVLAGGMAWELLKMVLRVVYTLLRLTMLQILLVYLCQKLALVNEMYFSIILDRKSAGPLVIACNSSPADYHYYILTTPGSLFRPVCHIFSPSLPTLCVVPASITSNLQRCTPIVGSDLLVHPFSYFSHLLLFDIWDTAGQERYHSLAPIYFRGVAAVIVIYDISSIDLGDVEGDKAAGLKTLAIRLGVKQAFWLCISLIQAYGIAITMGALSPVLWSKIVTVVTHIIMVLYVWNYDVNSVDLSSKDSLHCFDMFMFK